MRLARERLETEINIIEIVKSWRYIKRAIQILLPEKKRIDIREKTCYIAIDPNEEVSRGSEVRKSESKIFRRTT